MKNDEAAALVAACRRAGVVLATAESCTGGMIAAAITDVSGSSAAFDRGFVTYSNAAKVEMLGVDAALIDARGAVSAEVAAAMAVGAMEASSATLAVAVTGIAGPGGGSAEKPAGLVHLAVAAHKAGKVTLRVERRLDLATAFASGGRDGVRRATVTEALRELQAIVDAP